jgi:hypothetical protein
MQLRKLFDYSVPLVAAATIFLVAVVLAVGVASYTAYQIKMSVDTIEVTGSAKESVQADFGRWSINLEARTGTTDQQSGFDRLTGATQKIVSYLNAQGFEEIETPSALMSPDYVYLEGQPPQLRGYIVSRQIIVRSNDVDKIEALAGSIAPLTGSGYTVSTNSVELTYTQLDEMRVKLLSQAVKDAQARAYAIAQESGRSVGVLRSASGGVVQVLPKGSIEVSDYGSYDTQSKDKEIMVTVRATFRID